MWAVRTHGLGSGLELSKRPFCDHMRSHSARLSMGRGKAKIRTGEGMIWPPLQVSVPYVLPVPVGLGCGTSECADPLAPGPAGGDRGQVHEGPRGEW